MIPPARNHRSVIRALILTSVLLALANSSRKPNGCRYKSMHLGRRVGQQLYRFSDARLARLYVVLHARRIEPF